MNQYECDKHKARSNYSKHGLRFTEAARALNSARTLTGRSPQSDDLREERNESMTTLADGRVIVFVWAPRNGKVRIISVRRASRREREAFNAYFQKLH
jgi:uncharacterized DUF497 family protein